MQLQIKYFGMLAEVCRCDEETIEFNGLSIIELLESLYKKYPALRDKDFKVAQQNEIVSNESKITGAEIALLPPFSGG